MADDLSLIVPIGAEISGLARGVSDANAALSKFEAEAKRIASASAASMASIARNSVQPYNLSGEQMSRFANTEPYKVMADKAVSMHRRIAREAEAAYDRVGDSLRASFGKATTQAESVVNGFAGKVKAILAPQVVGGVFALGESIANMFRGEWDKAYESLEKLPLGIGYVVSSFKGLVSTIAGYNTEIEKFREINAELDEKMASRFAEFERKRSSANVASDTQAIRSEIAAGSEVDPVRRAEIQLAEMLRIAEIRKQEMIRNGIDEATATANAAAWAERERIRIIKESDEERWRIEEEALHRRGRAEQRELDAQAERERIAESERKSRIDRENAWLRDNTEDLHDEMRSLSGVGASEFISTGNTAIGSFTMGQAGAAMTVARASQRQVEIQNELKEIASRIEENLKSRNAGWN